MNQKSLCDEDAEACNRGRVRTLLPPGQLQQQRPPWREKGRGRGGNASADIDVRFKTGGARDQSPSALLCVTSYTRPIIASEQSEKRL